MPDPIVVPEFPKLLSNPTSSVVKNEKFTVVGHNGTFHRPDLLVHNAAEEAAARADGYTVVVPSHSLPESPFNPSATVVPNPPAVPVVERHPAASELLAELNKKIGVWNGIEPAEFNKVTDAQSRSDVEQHLRDFERTHGADNPAVIEARAEWAKQRKVALAGYLGTLIGLIAKWVSVPPVKDALNDAEVTKHVVADRETAEAVNDELAALALKYGEYSEVVDEGRRLWNTAIRVGRAAPVVVAEPVVV